MDYSPIIVIAAILVAGITSLRLALVMGARWSLTNVSLGWFCIASVVAAAVISGVITAGAIHAGGNLFGLVSAVLSLPMVGFAWVFVIGGNKALERVLGGLLNKLS